MNTDLLTHPVVKSALVAWQAKDLAGWLAHFASGAKLFDDGAPRDLKAFSADIGKERFVDIESVSAGGLRVVGPFHSDQWGEFKTYFKFHLNADQKIDRLDIGQAN